MPKRKHPTAEGVRQGQTIYYVQDHFLMDDRVEKRPREVIAYHIYPNSVPMPKTGSIIEKLPLKVAQMMLKAIKKYDYLDRVFYSRRRAETLARRKY